MVAADAATDKLDAIITIEVPSAWSLSLSRVAHKDNIAFERSVL
jgi:hypothetical protein